MTEQQTAATDNALLERLEREARLSESIPEYVMAKHACLLKQAAERIKSLLAERAAKVSPMTQWLVGERNRLVAEVAALEADRQRMREALAHIKDADPGPTSDQSLAHDMARVAAQTLNPASKEAK